MIPYTCAQVEAWLDQHAADENDAMIAAHVARCARCSAAVQAARSIDEALGRPLAVSAPPGFTQRVMERLTTVDAPPAEEDDAARRPHLGFDLFLPLLSVVIALVAWRASPAWHVATASSAHALRWAERLARWWMGDAIGAGLDATLNLATGPAVALALGTVLVPGAVWAAWQLGQWLESLVAEA